MFKIKFVRLKTKLLLSYFSIILILLICSNYILINLAINNIKKNTLFYMELFVNQLSSNVDSYVSEMDRITKSIFIDEKITGLLEKDSDDSPINAYQSSLAISNTILKINTQQPDISNVILLSNSGKSYASGLLTAVKDLDALTQFPWFKDIERANGGIVISPPHTQNYLYGEMNDLVFSIGRVIKNQNGKVIGKIILDIDHKHLHKFININSALSKYNTRVLIINKDNSILLDTHGFDNPDLFQGHSQDDPIDYKDLVVNKSTIVFETVSPYSNLKTLVAIPTKDLYHSIYRFNVLSFVILFVLLLISTILSFYFSKNIVKPIKKLEIFTTEIHNGNFKARSGISSNDEFGILAKNFDAMADKIQELIEDVLLSQLKNKQSQLEALQHQINPHFLLNTLESIRMKAFLNKDIEVATMIKHLGKLFHITLSKKNALTTIKDELEHVKIYVAIQNMRYNNRFTLNINVSEEILSCSIIKLVLQPLVENSILHGFDHTSEPGLITISGKIVEGVVILNIIDNGAGIEPSRLREVNLKLNEHNYLAAPRDNYKSIGLVNISDRISLEYGKEYSLRLYSSLEEGTNAELRIPQI